MAHFDWLFAFWNHKRETKAWNGRNISLVWYLSPSQPISFCQAYSSHKLMSAHVSSCQLISAHVSSCQLMIAHFSSFQLVLSSFQHVSAHVSSCKLLLAQLALLDWKYFQSCLMFDHLYFVNIWSQFSLCYPLRSCKRLGFAAEAVLNCKLPKLWFCFIQSASDKCKEKTYEIVHLINNLFKKWK